MSLFRRYITKEAKRPAKNLACVYGFIGDRVRFGQDRSSRLMDELETLTDQTNDNDLVHLTIALNYGGRDEVARATQTSGTRCGFAGLS